MWLLMSDMWTNRICSCTA